MTSLQQNEIISLLRRYGPMDTEDIAIRLEITEDTARTQCYRIRKKGFCMRDEEKRWYITAAPGEECEKEYPDTSIIELVEKNLDPQKNLPLADERGVVPLYWPKDIIDDESVLLGQPIDLIRHLQDVYRNTFGLDSSPFFSFHDIPPTPLGGLGVDDVDTMICVEGDVVGHEQPHPVPVKCRVQCPSCEDVFVSRLAKGTAQPITKRCPKEGCNGKVYMLEDSFISRTEQWFYMEEAGAYDQASKSFLRVCLPSELIAHGDPQSRIVRDGNTIRVAGVYRCYVTKEKNGFCSNMYIDASSIELVQSDIISVDVSEEDVELLREFSNRSNVGELLVDSVCPEVYGMQMAKRAMLLSSVYPSRDVGGKRRNFNLLMVGHTGIAKSRLARWWCNFYPRATFSSGVGSSTVGLFGITLRQEKKDGGRYTVLAGTIPRASGGIAVVDEVEKQIAAYGEGQFLEVLEDRTATIQKGDARAVLEADCPVWLLSNWKNMLPPDEFSPRIASIPPIISKALQNRCVILDMDFMAEDVDMESVSWRMLERFGEVPKEEEVVPPLDVEMFMKYLSLSRRYTPTIPLEVAEEIHRLFSGWRVRAAAAQRSGVKGGVFDLTARLQDDFSMAVCASAMLHWRDVVSLEDVRFALPIFSHMLERWAMDGGELDPGLLSVGLSGGESRIRTEVVGVLGSLGGLDVDALLSHVPELMEDRRVLDRMVEDGVLAADGGVYSLREMA